MVKPHQWACSGAALATTIVAGLAMNACQTYDVIFQPDVDRLGVHLQFAVEQPSKADILFVIDNSGSMAEEQAALAESIDVLLDALAPQDTEYRLGIVSTDARGFGSDCCGIDIATPEFSMGARGNCQSCTCPGSPDPNDLADANCGVKLRRPNDGTRGRLIAAYDPNSFDAFSATEFPDLNTDQRAVLATLLPTGTFTGPASSTGVQGARAVIDRASIKQEACTACAAHPTWLGGCNPCDGQDSCVLACAEPVAQSMVRAFFRANVRGLGTSGFGWEEGIESALLAVGIDPEDLDDDAALNPTYNLTLAGQPNTFAVQIAPGVFESRSWVRDDALLAVMFLSDEEDCSMPDYLEELIPSFESTPAQPTGSMCYQDTPNGLLRSVDRLSDLLIRKKGDTQSRAAVGFIGALEKTGSPGRERRDADAIDCVVSSGTPSFDCSCWASNPTNANWCAYTVDTVGTGPTCEALAGFRYVDFANQFNRRTYETICRAGSGAFGDSLADFARIATLACFDLQGTRPLRSDGEFVEVSRLTADEAANPGAVPEPLPRQSPESLDPGWYYDEVENRVCLTGLDRLIGDVYDIFMLTRDERDFTR